ncbi:MAG: hypothetical protein QXK90_00870 [Candidatus Parvarchaeota archaeon]
MNYLKGQVYIKEDHGVKTIVKKYDDMNSLKWFISPIISNLKSYPMTGAPISRLERELELYDNPIEGVNLPKLIRYDKEGLTLEKEFIEGEPPYKRLDLVGNLLYKLHSAGYVLGDSKIENFLLDKSNKKLYLIDSEQVYKSKDEKLRAWDISILFTSLSYNSNIKNYRHAVADFKSAYLLWDEVSGYTVDPKNLPILFIMPFPNLYIFLSEVGVDMIKKSVNRQR